MKKVNINFDLALYVVVALLCCKGFCQFVGT